MDKESIKTSFVIRNFVKFKNWFLNEHVIVKASISLLISAIGGSSIFTLINNYALYYHATQQGFRVPVEGVEYINFAISLLAIFLTLLAILGSWVLFYLLNMLSNSIIRLINKKVFAVIMGLLFFVGLNLMIYLFSKKKEIIDERIRIVKLIENRDSDLTDADANFLISQLEFETPIEKFTFDIEKKTFALNDTLKIPTKIDKEFLKSYVKNYGSFVIEKSNRQISTLKSNFNLFLFTLIFFILFFFLFMIINHRKKHIKNLVGAIIIVFIISTIVLLFNQNFYKSFLGQIGFGGEIPINIEYKQADDTKAIINGQLLIRTKYSVTVRKIENGFIEEIPNERIFRLEYY